MRIWLLQTWEPNPAEPGPYRPWRTGMLARALHARGHEVHWFASRFRHIRKTFEQGGPSVVEIEPGFFVHWLSALGYHRHVSVQRLRDHAHVARAFSASAETEDRPDAVVASYPTVEMSAAAARFCAAHGVPLMVDVRDRYPDLYWQSLPGFLQGAGKLAATPMVAQARRVFRTADGVTANGPDVLEWALGYAGRAPGPLDASLPMSYEPPVISESDRSNRTQQWAALGVYADDWVVAFGGTMAASFDLEPVLEAARRLQTEPKIKFVLCGDGPERTRLMPESADLENVIWPGRVDAAMLSVLYERAHIGLMPYRPLENFVGSITNKPVEYLACGMELASSLGRGTLYDLMTQHQVGFAYANGEELATAIRARFEGGDTGMQTRCQAVFEREFDSARVMNQWVELIERAVTQSATS